MVSQRGGANRSTAAMMLLLVVSGIATLGESFLALFSAIAASLSFSWYFIDQVGSLAITSVQGGITFAAMTITALTGTQLSIRAQRRADEAIRRRVEVERLRELGDVLLAAVTVAEAARQVTEKVVDLFALRGAVLRVEGEASPFRSGDTAGAGGADVSIMPIHAGSRQDFLELYGLQPSVEVRSALASMIGLVIERARSSEERARMQAAQRGDQMRSTVLNALAHDFKTPLTSIKAAASVLRASQSISSADDRELIVVIDEEADRLDRLIRESLDLARLEQHRANPRTEPCKVLDVVGGATARVARYMGRRPVEVDIPEDLPPLYADRFLLEQMLIQVLDNAGKYSAPGSPIRISGEERCGNLRSSIVIWIRNEGSHIPVEERVLIFDKFYRGSGQATATEGTGLGLAIARTIAEAHGGTLSLEIEGNGPAFRFEFPLSDAKVAGFAGLPASEPPPGAGGGLIAEMQTREAIMAGADTGIRRG